MKASVRKTICPVLALLVSLALLAATWVGYLCHLTAQQETACGSTPGVEEGNSRMRGAQEFQRVLDDYSAETGGIGLQATVVLPDGTSWSGTSGYASLERACPLTLRHHLYIGSMTKLYTAALVMVQVENGVISLDDSLDKWLDLPYANAVTVRMLLNHTSGIPSYTEDPWFLARYFGQPRRVWRTSELVSVVRNEALECEPGSRHVYSNSNYLLLGLVLERAAGRSYGELLQELVVDRMGLHDTYYFSRPSDLPIADGYDETLLHLGRRNLTGFRLSMETGASSAGGILSTSQDVASFVHSLFAGKVAGNATLAQMLTFVEAPDVDVPFQQGYGLGIRNLVVGGGELVGHTGTIPGYSGIAMHSRTRHYTIVVLSNLSVIDQTRVLGHIQESLLRNQVP